MLELWHGTNEDFEVFDTTRTLGVHFGTSTAAAERLSATGRVEHSNGTAAVPKPFAVAIDYALVMPDLGIWSFQSVLRQLREMDVLSAGQADTAYSAMNQSDEAGWKVLKEFLNQEGYDGMKYVNLVEDAGSESWIAFEADQVSPIEPDLERHRE